MTGTVAVERPQAIMSDAVYCGVGGVQRHHHRGLDRPEGQVATEGEGLEGAAGLPILPLAHIIPTVTAGLEYSW